MIDHAAHISGVVRAQLKTVSFGNMGVGFVVSHGYAPVPTNDPRNPQTLGPAWIITITAKSALIGYPDIVLEAVLPGILPPDEHFRAVVDRIYEASREEQAKQMNNQEPSQWTTAGPMEQVR
jgi:hypothetical protein